MKQVLCVPCSVREAVPEVYANVRLTRVLRAHAGIARVLDEVGERTLRLRAAWGSTPSIAGEWGRARRKRRARALLSRANLLSRRAAGKVEVPQALAANVDAVWIMTALDDPHIGRADHLYPPG